MTAGEASDATSVRMREWGEPAEHADLAVLTVHGRGQDPGFMRTVSERFGAAPVRFYAPHASGDSWYPQPFMEPRERNQPELERSLANLDSCLDSIAAAGFPTERVVLWGFSQGACLLAEHVRSKPRRYAGVLLFTGGYLGPETAPHPATEPLRGVSVLLRSVQDDPWVPRHRVVETALLLSSAGAFVDLRIDAGQEHIITDEACRAATGLLTAAAMRTMSNR